MEFIQVVEGQPKLMDHRERQHAIGFASPPPLLLGSVEEGLRNACPLGLHEVHQNVKATKVSNSASSIVAPHVSLLDGSAGALLCSFNVVCTDVLLGWHETLPLKVSHLLVEVSSQRGKKSREGVGQVKHVGVNLHVHVVGTQQRFVPLAQVEVVSVEVGSNLVDVSQG